MQSLPVVDPPASELASLKQIRVPIPTPAPARPPQTNGKIENVIAAFVEPPATEPARRSWHRLAFDGSLAFVGTWKRKGSFLGAVSFYLAVGADRFEKWLYRAATFVRWRLSRRSTPASKERKTRICESCPKLRLMPAGGRPVTKREEVLRPLRYSDEWALTPPPYATAVRRVTAWSSDGDRVLLAGMEEMVPVESVWGMVDLAWYCGACGCKQVPEADVRNKNERQGPHCQLGRHPGSRRAPWLAPEKGESRKSCGG